MPLIIYHNPRCSKSRQTLALIEDAGIEVEIIRYLDDPLSAAQITQLRQKLGAVSVRDFMRKGEAIYKALGLGEVSDEAALIAAMAQNPKLIERPIAVKGETAILSHPPENVTVFLSSSKKNVI